MNEIKNRLTKRVKHLKKWAKRENINAYRLYDRDIPEYPYQIDIYGKNVVFFDKGNEVIDAQKKDHFNETIDAVKELMDIDENYIYIKSRKKQRGDNQYEKLSRDKEETIIQEKQAYLRVNLSDYLDTGLFLDHRPLRQLVYQNSKDKNVLNLFSYTCSIGLFAALAGARTTNVDLSNTYLNWGVRNYQTNNINIDSHRFVNADVKQFLENDESEYDLIILDPPTFSNSKSMDYVFDVQKMAPVLIKLCLKLLRPEGVLYFSNNKRDFKWDKQWENQFSVKDLTSQSIPEDFRDKKIHKLYEIRKLI